MAIACRNDEDWSKLAQVISEEWTGSYIEQNHRLEHQDDLDLRISEWTRDQDKFALQVMLREQKVPVAAVQKPQERIDQDATTEAFGLWPEVQYKKIGPVRVDGLPIHFSDTDLVFHR